MCVVRPELAEPMPKEGSTEHVRKYVFQLHTTKKGRNKCFAFLQSHQLVVVVPLAVAVAVADKGQKGSFEKKKKKKKSQIE